MKKMSLILVILVLCMIPSGAEDISWGSLYETPNFLLSVSGAWESSTLSNVISLSGGGEYIFWKPSIGSITPLDIGAGARLRIGLALAGGFYTGAGIMATAHWGFNGLGTTMGVKALDNTEIFIEMGVCADFIRPDTDAMFGLLLRSGVRYMISDNLLLESAYTTWRGASGIAIGASYRLGKGQAVTAQQIEIPTVDIAVNTYLMQFQTFYWYSFAMGGMYFDDSTYKEGAGTSWLISSGEAGKMEDEFTIDRSLISINADGSKWWKIKIKADTDVFVYEFLVDTDFIITRLICKDIDSGDIITLIKEDDKNTAFSNAGVNSIDEAEYTAWSQGTEEVKVAAGTFQAEYIKYEFAEQKILYQWWISDSVPGGMVKYNWTDNEEQELAGELIKILQNEKSELNGF